jgi:hypothetical protein
MKRVRGIPEGDKRPYLFIAFNEGGHRFCIGNKGLFAQPVDAGQLPSVILNAKRWLSNQFTVPAFGVGVYFLSESMGVNSFCSSKAGALNALERIEVDPAIKEICVGDLRGEAHALPVLF